MFERNAAGAGSGLENMSETGRFQIGLVISTCVVASQLYLGIDAEKDRFDRSS